MERGNNQQHIRVIGRGEIVDLDANRLGDWCIQFHIGIFFNPSRAPFQCYLTQQPHNFCALIEVFGPNQFVLVATSGDPCSSELTDLFSPQTLYGCLHFTYVCWSVIIHGVPKSSGARLCGHHQVGNLICRSVDWTQATFHANRERFGGLRYGHIDLPKDSYRRYLFNGQPNSKWFQGVQYAKQTHPGQGN